MEVLLIEKHELPEVYLNTAFPVGRAADPVGKPGLAEMVASVWDEGTERRSSEAIAADLAGIGASLHVGADWDTTTLHLFTLRRQLGKALDIYADVLRNPTFPKEELDRQRAMTLGRLVQVRNEPVMLASLAATQVLYGPEHPYGHPQFGSPASLKDMSQDDLKRFYRSCIRPEGAGLIAVGDITLAELTAELEKVLGGWKAEAVGGQAPHRQEFPPVPQAKPTSIVLIDKPGAAQSVVQLALIGAQRKSPDYFKLAMMNTVFGGQFSSRLNMNLRETKGYTYGARSSFDWRVHQPGPFLAAASVQTAVTAPALTEFLKEMEGLAGARPVAEKELDFCQKFLIRGYTAGFETPSQLATQLEILYTYKLPDDYFNTYVPNIAAVRCDDVTAMAKKHLRLDRLGIIIVGDRKAVEPELKKLPAGKELTVYQFDPAFKLAPVK
jgi:predicted Zn-dependent peptidase